MEIATRNEIATLADRAEISGTEIEGIVNAIRYDHPLRGVDAGLLKRAEILAQHLQDLADDLRESLDSAITESQAQD